MLILIDVVFVICGDQYALLRRHRLPELIGWLNYNLESELKFMCRTSISVSCCHFQWLHVHVHSIKWHWLHISTHTTVHSNIKWFSVWFCASVWVSEQVPCPSMTSIPLSMRKVAEPDLLLFYFNFLNMVDTSEAFSEWAVTEICLIVVTNNEMMLTF